MASPTVVEGRVDPHRKAHFSLHISDRITQGNAELGSYSSVKYNHKPAQTTASRKTTLAAKPDDTCLLTIDDQREGDNRDIFVFRGQRTVPKKSYLLLFDPASQKATLEPLSSTYTLNLSKKNTVDISSQHPKIYPRKQKEEAPVTAAADDLFDEGVGELNDVADPDNPFDFRHFLNKEKKGDESEYNVASSPDYRTGTGSAMNTPQFPARKPAPTAAAAAAAAAAAKTKATSQAAPSKPKKRKPEPEPLVSRKPAEAKKPQAPPIRLERRATEQRPAEFSTPSAAKPARKHTAGPSQPPSSKIKSSEIVHSSDEESDVDAAGARQPEHIQSPPHHPRTQRSPSPAHVSDDDDDMEDVLAAPSGLEIEVPDARPAKPRPNALASLGLGQNLGLGYLKSPSNGPISLVSAANSVEGSPDPRFTPRPGKRGGGAAAMGDEEDGVIDFGDLGGVEEEEDDEDADADDGDVEPMDIGPPAAQQQQQRRVSVDRSQIDEEMGAGEGPGEGEGEEDDQLYKEMMEGLAGGESSEESEEE